ncbi:MAG: TIGR02453 family protein [Flavobacteriaceae bacterium]|nr:TIGR02453 family protein [Flavobacteriaceae bacterium]
MSGIDPQVLKFFKTLSKNNNREWFEAHKPKFKALEADIKGFVKTIAAGLQDHDKIEKAKLFRIYRDVRFSKNKTPYKTHFGMAFHREKPSLRGGYYIHLEPKNSFIGVGFWGPSPLDLFRIRKELEVDAEELRQIMADPTFISYWGTLQGDEVKTAPKGFNKEHSNIDLIKKKQYIFHHLLSDQEVLDPNFSELIDDHFQNIRPYFDYMSSVLTTDLNGESIL